MKKFFSVVFISGLSILYVVQIGSNRMEIIPAL